MPSLRPMIIIDIMEYDCDGNWKGKRRKLIRLYLCNWYSSLNFLKWKRFMWQFEGISLEGMVIFSNSLLLSGIIGAHLTAISQTLHPSIIFQTFPILFSQSLSVIFSPQVSHSLWNKYYLSIDTVQNSTIGFMDYLGKVWDDHRNAPF